MAPLTLAELIELRAKESAARDKELLEAIGAIHVTQAVHAQRIGAIEATCEKRGERAWAEHTGEYKAMKESSSHWVRYVIATIVLAVMMLGSGCFSAYAARHLWPSASSK